MNPIQLDLPGMLSTRVFNAKTNLIRLRTMDLNEGIEYLNNQRKRKIEGNWIEDVNKSSATRLKMFRAGQVQCVTCGLAGEHFHIERHKNDKIMPFSINLYGWKGDREVMLTWDHILPRSLGGSDRIENAQCMCSDCNSAKGNFLSIVEIVEIVTCENADKMYRTAQNHPSLKDIINQVKRDSRI